MSKIVITEKERDSSNLLYIQSSLCDLFGSTRSGVELSKAGGRCELKIECVDYYYDIVLLEVVDKIAEVIVIKYKYDYFSNVIRLCGLNKTEKEILFASLIAADLEDDKKYVFSKIKGQTEIAIDGFFNFKLQQLKKKWQDVASYIPLTFVNSQLNDFITFLLENRKKRVYIDDGKVYDCHYRRLKRCSLLGGDSCNIVREVLLSGCGEIQLSGAIDKGDEYYLKEFYKDKIYFSGKYYD